MKTRTCTQHQLLCLAYDPATLEAARKVAPSATQIVRSGNLLIAWDQNRCWLAVTSPRRNADNDITLDFHRPEAQGPL